MTGPSHKERAVAGIGAGLSILIVFGLTRMVSDGLGIQAALVASMGASAVLLFAVPHGPMSQPWNVIAGHGLSSLIGLAAGAAVADPVLACALAAGLAVFAMHHLGCLHPPGGASSLIPILSGVAADGAAPWPVLVPIWGGAVLMVAIATLYNLGFGWRRYPVSLWARTAAPPPPPPDAAYPDISHADFVAALAEIDTFVDITEEDLLRIYAIAVRRDTHADR